MYIDGSTDWKIYRCNIDWLTVKGHPVLLQSQQHSSAATAAAGWHTLYTQLASVTANCQSATLQTVDFVLRSCRTENHKLG